MLNSLTVHRHGTGVSAGEAPQTGGVQPHRETPAKGPHLAVPTSSAGSRDASSAAPSERPRKGLFLRFLVLFMIAGVIGAGTWYYVQYREKDEGRLILQGNVDVRQVNLAFKVDGRIATLAADEGDRIEAGQVLATLEARYFEDELRMARARRDNQKAVLERLEHGSRPEEISEARAALAERQASLENARQALKRRENLLPSGSVSSEEYDNALATYNEDEARCKSAEEALKLAEIGPRQEEIDAARAQLRAEEVSVSQAERRLADSRLVAPGDGVILTRAREVGAIVQPGETVLTLTLATPVWVRTYIAEPDLGRVRPGTEVDVVTDGKSGRVYRGHIGFVSPTAEFTPKNVETTELRTRLVYRLRIVVQDPDGGLRQGMPVTVRFPMADGGQTR